MEERYIDIRTVADLHRFYRCGMPKHPLITIIDYANISDDRYEENLLCRSELYVITCKVIEGSVKYGQSYYDFGEGTLMFAAPQQVLSATQETKIKEGWGLFFHPDILYSSELGKKIHGYSFFNYSVNEALHISEEEKNILHDCLDKIKKEYKQNLDKHTHGLILDNLGLLLNYCNRFYDRQFFTREKVSNELVQKFETLLNDYFSNDNLVERGLPNVKYFASKMCLSSNYLSDLLNKFTGKTTQEHIHLQLIDRAKTLLWGTDQNISEIAYNLGFEHPSHFTKLFKSKVGISPKEFRVIN